MHFQIQNAAEEPRVLCIIQDTTNSRTINERLTLNLPASTTLSKLHKDVAHKAGYVNGSFELAWGNAPNMVRRFNAFIQPVLCYCSVLLHVQCVHECCVAPQEFPAMLVYQPTLIPEASRDK